MKQYWQNLQARERYTLIAAALVLLLLLVYLLLIEPWQKESERLRASIESQQQTLQWMQQAAVEVKQLRRAGGSQTGSGQSLMSIIDNSTRQAGLAQAVRQLRPDGASVSVRLENAAFDDMLRWLGQLHSKHGINVSHFTMERLAEAGRVNASVMLAGLEP